MPKHPSVFLIAVGVCGFVSTFHPTLFSGFERMQPDAGDVALNNYFLEHTYLWAFGRDYPHSFWSPAFFAPTPNTLAYSETLIGTAPIYWLLRSAFSESVSGQLWIMFALALNYISMAVVLRWFGLNTVLTAIGAYMFAFGLMRIDHLTHQQLMPQYFSPLAVWFAWACLRQPTIRRWIMLIALGLAQTFASLHLGWFLVFGLGIFVILGLFVEADSFRRMRGFIRENPVTTMLPLLVAAVLLGFYARNYYRGTPNPRYYSQVSFYLPYPDAWFVAPPGTIWADHLTPRGEDQFAEKTIFVGFVAYGVCLLAGCYAWRHRFPQRNPALASLGTAAILIMLITRWVYDVSLWYPVHQLVPGANAFRAVGRMVFVIHLSGTIGGLLGLQAFVEARVPRPSRRVVLYSLIGLCIAIEQLQFKITSFDKREMIFEPARQIAPQMVGADAAYLVYDGSLPDYRHHITAMWAGLWARTPVLNGFSGTHPPNYPALSDRPTISELVLALGPGWQGKLVLIELGPPITRQVYEVRDGQATPTNE